MNKNAIQKYAIWARNELIEQVKQRAYQYGINEKGHGDNYPAVIAGRVLTADEKQQRQDFLDEIKKNGYQQAVEEVAYTWFNRFVALRYMEVNDYLPAHVRMFSDANGGFNPEILKDVLHLDLPGLDKAKVSDLLNANKTEELYRYLLLTQCNALNDALPEMFERLGSYTEMLLPNNILKQDSVLARLVKDIPEEDWKDQVQIIGWLYQYYNTEPKQAVFDGLKKNIKITKEKIPAATQLFTPDWIVRYMVENSLGRLWLETLEAQKTFDWSHLNWANFSWGADTSPKQEALKKEWKYYLDEAPQEQEVAKQLYELRKTSRTIDVKNIKLIDPCMGSGHILVYAFDVLMQIYESEGYNPRDAAKLILEKNIYGLDIDCRAYQLAYFSLMMKARQYNRRIFTEDIKPQVYHPAGFPDGEEYGSLVKVDTLPMKPVEKTGQLSLEDTNYDLRLNAWNFKRLLVQKYDVVVTNPPYMGSKQGMNDTIKKYLSRYYKESKSDLFAAFMSMAFSVLKKSGFLGMINQHSWMFLSSFSELRKSIVDSKCIINMIHLGAHAFEDIGGEVVQSTSFVMRNDYFDYSGRYVRLVDVKTAIEKESEYLALANGGSNAEVDYQFNMRYFSQLPDNIIGYWIAQKYIDIFENQPSLTDVSKPRQGLSTSDNDRFLKFWYEPSISNIGIGLTRDEAAKSGLKWFPYNKGGEFRKWFGNNNYVINWQYDGKELRDWADWLNTHGTSMGRLVSQEFYFMKGLTWSGVGASRFGVRCFGIGMLFDVGANGLFVDGELYYYLAGFLNTKIADDMLKILNPTINTGSGTVGKLPFISSSTSVITGIESDVKRCINLSKSDWDAFETSWDFKRHPLLCRERTVAAAFGKWERESAERFDTLKANEEELNRIFIGIYGLQDELTPEVEDKDVTVRLADLGREIRSLISYAVGCMFGRYSLDIEGLAYAGGDWVAGKYKTFIPDKDNILPICDDEYFDDDIVGRFVDFVRVVYGAETLEENLKFIADALGGKGTPREVIRNYLLNDFYADHCKIYQKRPIYWLFDSGKKNGFKALVYLHRYSRDLLAKLRTDYVHEQQERYRTQLAHIAAALNTAASTERAQLLNQQDKLTEQLKEITGFEEKVHHLADRNIEIDLDDGVKKNYEIFADVLAEI